MAKSNRNARNNHNLRNESLRLKQPSRQRASTVELELRHAEVASLLLSRFSRAQIVEISRKKWGIKKAQADDYIDKAKQLIRARIAEYKDMTIDDHLDSLFDLVRRARGANDMRMEHDLRKDIAKLRGLYPAERNKVEHSGEVKMLSPEQIEQKRQERLRKAMPALQAMFVADASSARGDASSESDNHA